MSSLQSNVLKHGVQCVQLNSLDTIVLHTWLLPEVAKCSAVRLYESNLNFDVPVEKLQRYGWYCWTRSVLSAAALVPKRRITQGYPDTS